MPNFATCSKRINLKIIEKIAIYKAVLISQLYGCGTWTTYMRHITQIPLKDRGDIPGGPGAKL